MNLEDLLKNNPNLDASKVKKALEFIKETEVAAVGFVQTSKNISLRYSDLPFPFIKGVLAIQLKLLYQVMWEALSKEEQELLQVIFEDKFEENIKTTMSGFNKS